MIYNKTNWIKDTTVISSKAMNNIEDGIYNAHQEIELKCDVNHTHKDLEAQISSIIKRLEFLEQGEVKPIPVVNVTLSKSSHTFTTENETLQLVANVFPSDATNKSVVWESSNTNIATVNNGLVTARTNGSCMITVRTVDGNKVANCNITVAIESTQPSGEITLVSKVYYGIKGDYAYVDGNCTIPNVKYYEANSPDGWIGVAELIDGKFKIDLTWMNWTGTFRNCTIEARNDKDEVLGITDDVFTIIVENGQITTVPVSGVTISKTSHSFTNTNTLQLTHTVSPSNATNKDVSWSSSNTSVATVNSTGLVTPRANGSCQIKVRTNDGGKEDICNIVVDIAVTPPIVDKNSYRSVAYVAKPWEYCSTALDGLEMYKNYDYGTALICLPVDCGFTTNNPTCDVTEAMINIVCDKAESLGLQPILKMHTVSLETDGQGNVEQPSNAQTWFANYRTLVNKYADIVVKKGYKEFIISNEMNKVTNISSWKQYFVPTINDVKSKGLRVSCSVNYPEVFEQNGFQYFDELDFFSLNLYVSFTDKGKTWAKANRASLREGFYHGGNTPAWARVEWGNVLASLGGNNNLHKDIWLTEVGCIPNEKGLMFPASWAGSSPYDEEVQKIYMDVQVDILENDIEVGKLTNRIKRYMLWDGNSDSDFNVVGKQAESVLKQFWEGEIVEPPEPEEPEPPNPPEPPAMDNYFDISTDNKYPVNADMEVDTNAKTITITSSFTDHWDGYGVFEVRSLIKGKKYKFECTASSNKSSVMINKNDKGGTIYNLGLRTQYSCEFTCDSDWIEINFGFAGRLDENPMMITFSKVVITEIKEDTGGGDIGGGEVTPPNPESKNYFNIDGTDKTEYRCSHMIDKSINTVSVVSVNEGGIDGYMKWRLFGMKQGRRYKLTCTTNDTKSFVRVKSSSTTLATQDKVLNYEFEFTGANSDENLVMLEFGIRHRTVPDTTPINVAFKDITIIDLDGDPDSGGDDNITYRVVDYKVIVSDGTNTETYHACAEEPRGVGVDGFKKFVYNGVEYYLSLTKGATTSRITINGMKPFNYNYIDPNFRFSNRAYGFKNKKLHYTVRNSTTKPVNQEALEEAIRVFNCAMPGKMSITLDPNSPHEVLEDYFTDEFFGICRLYDGSKFDVHMNTRFFGDNCNNDQFVKILVHEFGHITGIWDDSPHFPSMYNYDRNWAKTLYLQPSDIANIEYNFKDIL